MTAPEIEFQPGGSAEWAARRVSVSPVPDISLTADRKVRSGSVPARLGAHQPAFPALMDEDPQPTMERLLKELEAGRREAFDELFSYVYGELSEIAHRIRQRWQGDDTLNTTALINGRSSAPPPRFPYSQEELMRTTQSLEISMPVQELVTYCSKVAWILAGRPIL